ncbi:MAG TPA: SDR family oxidoreductase [Pseudonocardiaceae bacterium]|nr:SDR family oxidoreductase [Pseudonocardiaceae bacterium]
MTRRRVALVTGASRGIGAAIAHRLAADGFSVAVNSHPDRAMLAAAEQVAAAIRNAGGSAAAYPADVSDAADVDRLFTACEAELGTVDTLVLNAAVDRRVPWHEITGAEWDEFMAVNLKGAFLCCQRAFGADAAHGGVIVTVGSVLAETGAPNSLHYATTKAGIVGFTRSLARELGDRDIRVNAVVPGAIRTEAEAVLSGDPGPVVDARVLARQALRRRGVPDDIAAAVRFLVGADSAFMTGQTLCVDGGWLLH